MLDTHHLSINTHPSPALPVLSLKIHKLHGRARYVKLFVPSLTGRKVELLQFHTLSSFISISNFDALTSTVQTQACDGPRGAATQNHHLQRQPAGQHRHWRHQRHRLLRQWGRRIPDGQGDDDKAFAGGCFCGIDDEVEGRSGNVGECCWWTGFRWCSHDVNRGIHSDFLLCCF